MKLINAGWSSPVARQAHNLKVVGSNPTPATNNFFKDRQKDYLVIGPPFSSQSPIAPTFETFV